MSHYHLDLRDKPTGYLVGKDKVVAQCPKCKLSGYLFKTKHRRNHSRVETWHHEVDIQLVGNEPKLNDLVDRCEVEIAGGKA